MTGSRKPVVTTARRRAGVDVMTLFQYEPHVRSVLTTLGVRRLSVPRLLLVAARVKSRSTLHSWVREGDAYHPVLNNALLCASVCFGDVPREVIDDDPVAAYWNSTFESLVVDSAVREPLAFVSILWRLTWYPGSVTLEQVLDLSAKYAHVAP